MTSDGRRLPQRTGAGAPNRNEIHASVDKQYGRASGKSAYPVDITGSWRNDYRWTVTVDDLAPKPVPFTADGRRIYEATQPWHDYSLRCVAPGLPRIFGAPYNVDIVDAGDHYLMIYLEHNTPRRIWMDGRSAPPNTPSTPMGFSVGKWEGETFVAQTVGFNDKSWFDDPGHPHSDELRVTERFRRINFGRMEMQITFDDPKAYTKPWGATIPFTLLPDTELIESICENEKDHEHMVGK